MKVEARETILPSTRDDFSKKKSAGTFGAVEITIRDRNGVILEQYSEPNIVKIFAKEMLPHRLPSSEIWNPLANGGLGNWEPSNVDPKEEFAARYIVLGASFDNNGLPVNNDPRYYVQDSVTGLWGPIQLGPGADYNGSLINPIPLNDNGRPLKKIEGIVFNPSYQPAGTPIMQENVRAVNNTVRLSTVLKLDEYNGFGRGGSDFFTITEVALMGGMKHGLVGTVDYSPTALFLEGREGTSGSEPEADKVPFVCGDNTHPGINGNVLTITQGNPAYLSVGDQIKLVGSTDSPEQESIPQVSPFYLITGKIGPSIELDRTPIRSDTGNPVTGSCGIYRDSMRIFSHRILSAPCRKSADVEITITWVLMFS